MSPVVSSGFSMLLLGESTGPGEKEAWCSSGDPREPRRGDGDAQPQNMNPPTHPQTPPPSPHHSLSLSEGEWLASGLCGTWVPLACGSFGVAVELLEGNTGRGWCWWHRGGTQQAPGVAVSPPHSPPEAGGVLQPGDLQAAQRLRHVPGAQREALELRGRDQVETCRVFGEGNHQGPPQEEIKKRWGR